MPKDTSFKNAGRSTTGEARVPYYLQSPRIEAAKHLRLTVTRYLNERASFNEVEKAMNMLRAEVTPRGAGKGP